MTRERVRPGRVRPRFTPKFEGPIEGWAKKYIHKNMWRISPRRVQHDPDTFEDLMQDAYLYFLIICNKYPYVVHAPHFMRLFQTSFSRYVTDLSNGRTKRSVEVADVAPDGESSLFDLLPHTREDVLAQVEARLLIEDAPPVVQDFLHSIMEGKPRYKKKRSGVRETTRSYMARLAGVDPDEINMPDIVRRWLWGIPQVTCAASPR